MKYILATTSFFLILTISMMFSSNTLNNSFVTDSKINVEKITLENGMEVLLIPNHRVPAVMHMVWYRVGGMNEVDGYTGLAHYLEHLMFHGTKKYPKDEIDKRISSFGGSHNAFTSYDFTAYYQNIPKEYLNEVMDMESDRMRGLILEKKATETERDIVLEERLLRRDNSPKSILSEKVKASLFSKEHPYGRPLIGYEEDISKLTLDDAIEFYNKYYHPNNAILVLAGDISRNEVMPLIEQYYGKLPQGPKQELQTVETVEKITTKEIKHYDKNTSNVTLKMSYLAPDLMSKNKQYSYPLSVISHLLGGNQNSILYKKLVIQENLAINVSSSYSSMSRGQSSFSINITLKDRINEDKVRNIINDELAKLKQGKVKKKDLSNTKKLFLIESLYSKESYKSLAYIIAMNYTTGINLDEILDWDKNIASVTLSDIKEASNFIFQDNKSVLGYLMPQKQNDN